MNNWTLAVSREGRLKASYIVFGLVVTFYQTDDKCVFECEHVTPRLRPSVFLFEELLAVFPSLQPAEDKRSFSLSEPDVILMRLMI